jgi:hypothetical protein
MRLTGLIMILSRILSSGPSRRTQRSASLRVLLKPAASGALLDAVTSRPAYHRPKVRTVERPRRDWTPGDRPDRPRCGCAGRNKGVSTFMLLSRAHRFIFVRGRKVAGTSLEMALSTICGPDDIIPPMIPIDERKRQAANGSCRNFSDHPTIEKAYARLVAETPLAQLDRLHPPPSDYTAHMSLTDIADRYPGSLNGFRVVVAQRCPYARVLSALNMAGSFGAYLGGGAMEGDLLALPERFDRALAAGAIHRLRNLDLYRRADGALDATIIRYERLQADLAAFLAEVGHAAPVALPHAKRGRMSNQLNPAEILRRDQIARINDIFADEFELFGYPRL